MKNRRSFNGPKAFSLVEIVLAMGIVSFAMISILGLVPLGLTTFRNAMNLSVEAGIAQRLVAEVQRTDFTNLSATNFLFDDQGVESLPEDAIFTAQVDPPKSLQAPGIMRANPPARTILIRISNRYHPGVTNSYPVVVPGSF